ncbi:hypothetical protein E4U37_007445 [Claviceps purpurea]|nr:hypothetical protein E4U37_007445 [Claviceps purpurea]
MAHARARSADEISSAEFWGLVAEYPAVVKAVSESRTGHGSEYERPSSNFQGPWKKPPPQTIILTSAVKPGQKTLLELDAYRYGDALGAFCVEDPPEMTLAQVQDLVEWKLYLSPLYTLPPYISRRD